MDTPPKSTQNSVFFEPISNLDSDIIQTCCSRRHTYKMYMIWMFFFTYVHFNKLEHGLFPPIFSALFQYRDIQFITIAQEIIIYMVHCRTELKKRSLLYVGASYYIQIILNSPYHPDTFCNTNSISLIPHIILIIPTVFIYLRDLSNKYWRIKKWLSM